MTTTMARRFIPARAGNGVRSRRSAGTVSVHPRACGERALGGAMMPTGDGSSPRVRGTVGKLDQRGDNLRFIPARAGNG